MAAQLSFFLAYIQLTGHVSRNRKKKIKLRDDAAEEKIEDLPANQDERVEDAEDHEGWWKVDKFEHIRDDVCIEFLPGCYARALSNGTVILGQIHPPGEGPDEEEIFTVVCPTTDRFALKSGYGRYLSVDTRNRLMGLSEAIGEQELLLPVFEDGKLAISAHNDCFLSPDEETDSQLILARAKKAGPNEMLNIRINHDPYFKNR